MCSFYSKSYLVHSFSGALFEDRASFADSPDTAVKRVGNEKGRKLNSRLFKQKPKQEQQTHHYISKTPTTPQEKI